MPSAGSKATAWTCAAYSKEVKWLNRSNAALLGWQCCTLIATVCHRLVPRGTAGLEGRGVRLPLVLHDPGNLRKVIAGPGVGCRASPQAKVRQPVKEQTCHKTQHRHHHASSHLAQLALQLVLVLLALALLLPHLESPF